MIYICQINGKNIRYLKSRFFTMDNGRKYEIIATEKIKSKHIHTVKNDKGEYREFEHDELMTLIEKYP